MAGKMCAAIRSRIKKQWHKGHHQKIEMKIICVLMGWNCLWLICIENRWETGTPYNFIHIWVPPLFSPLLLTRGQMRAYKAHSWLEKGHAYRNWSLLQKPWITMTANNIKARTFKNQSIKMLSCLETTAIFS